MAPLISPPSPRPSPESDLWMAYALARDGFIADRMADGANYAEARDDAYDVESLGDGLVDFARKARAKIGGTPKEHIDTFCDEQEECGEFLRACAMLRLYRVEAAETAVAA